jgi:hypothetical protein
MRAIPYIVEQEAAGRALSAIDPEGAIYNEGWLQELIRLHPDILPVKEFGPVFFPLIPLGREVPTSSGNIDNLFISPQGYLVLVETKLWRNPEAKRDVVAQSIDYASAISRWKFSDLDQAARKFTRQVERSELGLVEWIERYTHEPLDEESKLFFEDAVSKNLRLGKYLLLIVGDRIRSSVVDMLSYINKYPHLALNAALVELQCFQLYENCDWPMLVIPSVLAQTEIVERSIVQINVALDGTHEVTATQEKPTQQEKTLRSRITEDEFWDRLNQQAPDSAEAAKKIIEYYRGNDAVFLTPRSNSISIRMYTPESRQKISLFFIRTDGVVECWPAVISSQLEKAGLPQEVSESYFRNLGAILPTRTKTLSISYPASQVDAARFIQVVDSFIDQIMHAAPD